MSNGLYFPHDHHSRHDEKMLFLISKYGPVSYGLYWIWVEMMHEKDNSQLSTKLKDGISKQYNVDITLLDNILKDSIDIGLLTSVNGCYYSERVLENKAKMERYRRQKSKAGTLGMSKRYGKKYRSNSVITLPNNKIKQNKTKVKEIKDTIPSGDEDFGLPLRYMNKVFKSNFDSTNSHNQSLIKALLKHGTTMEDMQMVIDFKYQEWGDKPNLMKNLRPITLFRQSNFSDYLDQARTWSKKK